jgi:MFS family permease
MAAPGPSAADETPAPFQKAGGESGATKRLRPLFVASFLQSVAFWYAIEKLLMHRTGLTDGQIVMAGIVLSVSILLFQIPSGILADRHSRRGALIVASLFLIASTVVGTQAYSKTMFYLSDALWGVFAAIAKGTDDAIITT